MRVDQGRLGLDPPTRPSLIIKQVGAGGVLVGGLSAVCTHFSSPQISRSTVDEHHMRTHMRAHEQIVTQISRLGYMQTHRLANQHTDQQISRRLVTDQAQISILGYMQKHRLADQHANQQISTQISRLVTDQSQISRLGYMQKHRLADQHVDQQISTFRLARRLAHRLPRRLGHRLADQLIYETQVMSRLAQISIA